MDLRGTWKGLDVEEGELCTYSVHIYEFFEITSHCITLAVLELALQTRLASNSQRYDCFCLPSAGIKGVGHHCLAICEI